MTVHCRDCPLRGCDAFLQFEKIDIEAMERLKAGEMVVSANTQVLAEGSEPQQLYTVLEGMGRVARTLDMDQSQTLNFIFPGDLIGLQPGPRDGLKHNIVTTTEMRLCVFDRLAFWDYFRNHTERAAHVTWSAAIDRHFLGADLSMLSQYDARQRIAWAFVTIFLRGKALNLISNSEMPFPYRQQDLADVLGLSLVHTNKTLARFRDMDLATWSNGQLHIHDLDRLADEARMDLVPPDRRPLL